jgi:Protein of unknown function (DUF4038)/Domain of unknown function (DUF5060)
MREWVVRSSRAYENPFLDVAVDATFTAPDGMRYTMPGFYDGDGTWRVRFRPGRAGRWRCAISGYPSDKELEHDEEFVVPPSSTRGFLKSTPGQAWGFRYESGEPAFLLGDTVYNFFAERYLGRDIKPFLQRRSGQGFNLLRISLVPLAFCPPNIYAHWSDRRIWPWGGSDWWPQFDQFNVDYFRSVDETMRLVDEAGMGVEMILEFPGTASPFGRRDLFTAEYERLWLRYIIARYDAFTSVYFWNLSNEYEYLTNEYRHSTSADQWALRVARFVKELAPHGHPVAVHTGPELPPMAYRFRADPAAIDTILYQTWGTTGPDDAWLAAGIEDLIAKALDGWPGSAQFAEYGYESHQPVIAPGHQHLNAEHTRRGAWRAAFCGLGVTGGFDEDWWGRGNYDHDLPGVAYLVHMWRFFTEVVPFERMRPVKKLVLAGDGVVAEYLPTGGPATADLPDGQWTCRWYDPRAGRLSPSKIDNGNADWVAVWERQ